jgi:hypothetical protein
MCYFKNLNKQIKHMFAFRFLWLFLVRIRMLIQICTYLWPDADPGCPKTYGSGTLVKSHKAVTKQKKPRFFLFFFAWWWKDPDPDPTYGSGCGFGTLVKSHKAVTIQKKPRFFLFFCLMMEGSRYRCVLLTNGSGSPTLPERKVSCAHVHWSRALQQTTTYDFPYPIFKLRTAAPLPSELHQPPHKAFLLLA